jgi:SAM-dependent methyltransferase
VSPRVDFSGNADVYDRRHGALLSEDIVQHLAAVAALRSGMGVLDIGAGTGRVAVAIARSGCDVVALEPALAMAKALRTKAANTPVHIVASEGGQLPFAGSCFDAVVLARVLYLMADWRAVLSEACRVLKPGGHLLHEWGNGDAGEEWVQIRERARTLFEQAGIQDPFHPGARSEFEVDGSAVALGLIHHADVPAGAGPSLTLADFLRRLLDGEFSYIWNVPKVVQEECLPRLKIWAEETFDLERSVSMPRELHWTIYRKDAVWP